MYSTCLFCHSALGSNEVIERFPVGRRLAYDGERGRLWVVCARCRRWNLTPVEERWEAIEECERLFSDTRTRVSTDNIGLARLKEGLELVRIGRPQRPEFAAWRYGEQFGRRRRATLIKVGLGLGALGAVVAGGAAAGIGFGGVGWWVWQLGERIVHGSPDRVVARLPIAGRAEPLKVRGKHLAHLQLLGNTGEHFALGVPSRKQIVHVEGPEAVRAAGLLLPQLNRFGASRDKVGAAVALLEEERDPLRYFASVARMRRLTSDRQPKISKFPEEVRLALEMASHEETERRALEGELAMLEGAWKEAEEIAAIADNLFLPASVEDFIRRHRRG